MAFKGYVATVLLHDSVNDGKAQSGADAGRLRGEKGIENSRSNTWRNAWPIVGNFQRDSAARGAVRANPDVAASAIRQQRLLGIDEQIQDYLLQLVRIRHRLWKTSFQAAFHNDIFNSQLIAAQRQRALHNFI